MSKIAANLVFSLICISLILAIREERMLKLCLSPRKHLLVNSKAPSCTGTVAVWYGCTLLLGKFAALRDK